LPRARKKGSPPSPTIDTKSVAALLSLLSDHDWDDVSLNQIARKAKVPLATVQKRYKTLDDFIPLCPPYFDDQMHCEIAVTDLSPPDRLFDLLMSRFEALQQHRHAVLVIRQRIRHTPSLAFQILHPHLNSMRKIMGQADLSPKVITSDFAAYSLLGVYALTFYAWEQDESPDLTTTMARLDNLTKKFCSLDIFAAKHT
jgi:AcrR family transcriptional regulator